MQISKEEFLAWLANPVTEEVHKVLRERREKVAFQLVEGACLENMIEHAKAVGRCEEIRDLLEMTWEDMQPEKSSAVHLDIASWSPTGIHGGGI